MEHHVVRRLHTDHLQNVWLGLTWNCHVKSWTLPSCQNFLVHAPDSNNTEVTQEAAVWEEDTVYKFLLSWVLHMPRYFQVSAQHRTGQAEQLDTPLQSEWRQATCPQNTKQRARQAFTLQDTRTVVGFILNYAEGNFITLPSRTPWHWKTDVKLLPSNCSKKKVYDNYCGAAEFARCDQPLTCHCWYC